MKTENEIAEYLIKMFKLEKRNENLPFYKPRCEEHRASCQRFLEFLEREYKVLDEMTFDSFDKLSDVRARILRKIKDLQNAIKIYEKEGIK